MFRLILSDLRAKAAWCYQDESLAALIKVLLTDGTLAMVVYRAMQWARAHRLVPLEWVCNKVNVIAQGCIIGRGAEFGPRFVLIHSAGVVINGEVKGGSGIHIEHQVTIGAERRGSPRLGDDVFIGAGAKIVGPVVIGSHTRIGANAVVIADVPEDATAVGVPARIVRHIPESRGGLMPTTFQVDRRGLHRLVLTGLLIALPAAMASAQSASAPRVDARPSAAAASVVPPSDYVIGAGDLLSIVFWKEPDVSGQVRVRPDGKISLPLLRDVKAAGFTPDQLRQQLESVAKPFFTDVTATVMVMEINSRRVFVIGEVVHPGGAPLTGPMTVLQVLALAGGLTEFADKKHIEVVRPSDGPRGRFTFNYKDVLKGKKPDVELKPGDTVVVR